MKIANARWMKSKWFKIGAPIGIIVLSAGLYAYWSINTWNNYQTRFTGLQNDAQSKIKGALGLKVETPEERTKKLDALQASRDMLPTDKDSLCQVSAVVDWQNFVGNLREQKEKCNETKTKLVSLRSTLDKLVEYLEDEHALAKALSTLPAGGAVAEGDWAKQRDGYKAVLKSVGDAQATSDFTSIKQTAVEKLTSTVAAWEEVLAAHGAKDKARYTKAAAALAASYDGLQAVSKTSSDRLQVLVKSFEDSYAKL
jgi:hypothetical protein